MNNNNIHNNFTLNGHSFSSESELLTFVSKDNTLHSFLKDWFSAETHLIVQTSGSTGKAKAISLSKESMKNSAKATGEYFDARDNTTALCCLPVAFIAGKMMLIRALTLGWHLDMVQPSSQPLSDTSENYDFVAMIPWQARNSVPQLHRIKRLVIGGGQVNEELQNLLKEMSTAVYESYGMTETITHIALRKVNQGAQNYFKALPKVQFSTDERNCLIVHAPLISDQSLVTNDVVNLLSDTEFIWRGRIDHVINSGGVKLQPEEIEKKLWPIFNQRFFVAGESDSKLGEKLVLVLEDEVDESRTPAIIDQIKQSKLLKKYEIPKDVLFVKQFVETDTGKIQRQKTLALILP